MRFAWLALVVAVASASGAPPGSAERAPLVFAAASLAEAFEEIGRDFEARSGTRVDFSFAGSNVLLRQIQAGAPADVFVSANRACVDALEGSGLVEPDDAVSLLTNRLVVVVPAGRHRSFHDLAAVRTLALGDPEAVPAGIYARRWLESRGFWTALRERVVPTLDVRAALAAVASGGTEAAIVYRTDAALSSRVRVAQEIPPSQTPDITYVAALLARATSPQARPFLEHLRSTKARETFTRLGFETLATP